VKLQATGRKRKLGDIVLAMGLVSEYDLQVALKYQQDKNIRLGKALVELDLISDIKLLAILSEQHQIPIKMISEIVVNTDVFNIVPQNMIREYRFFPYDYDNTTVRVVIDDTVNLIMLDEVQKLLGRKLDVYLIREVEYERLIDKHLNDSKILEDLVDLEFVDKTINTFDVSTDEENSAVTKAVNSYLKQGYFAQASDIHFDITDKEMLVRYRIDGNLKVVQKLPKSSANFLVARIKLMAGLNTTETRVPQDGSMTIQVNKKEIDLRISVVPALFGEKVVIRILDNERNIRSLDNVGFSPGNLEKIKKIIKYPIGLILVTGPTGSGKSTLLYTFIHHVIDITKNIIAIEDPVEYKLPTITQISVNQASGLTFAVGLRAILRQDPDIILVGEIRDEVTAEIAVKASNTGHLVFSTLHTNSAVSSITRLSEVGVEPYLVAGSALGVVNQRLVRRLCPDCKEPYTSKDHTEDREFFGLDEHTHYQMYRPVGCTRCDNAGFSGRIPIHEVLILDEDLRFLISERKSIREIEELAIKKGMVTLKMDGLSKVMEGITTLEELRKYVV
jgi:type IV pilus assembly protein PilB